MKKINEYRLSVQIQNNLILSRIEAMGFHSVNTFFHNYHIPQSACELISMQKPALRKDGTWTADALHLSEALRVNPDEIFTDYQQSNFIIYQGEMEISEEDALALAVPLHEARTLTCDQGAIDDFLDREDMLGLVARVLVHLEPRHAFILKRRFGLDGEVPRTLQEVGQEMGLTRERIRQIETLALKKVGEALQRNPSFNRPLLDNKGSRKNPAPRVVAQVSIEGDRKAMFAKYHEEIAILLEELPGTTLSSGQVKSLFQRRYPNLRWDFVQPSDHCSNHTCKGACSCAGTNRGLFKCLGRNNYLVLPKTDEGSAHPPPPIPPKSQHVPVPKRAMEEKLPCRKDPITRPGSGNAIDEIKSILE